MGESHGIRRLSPEREAQFPRLARPNYEVTSDETTVYNCIAYAADDTTRSQVGESAGEECCQRAAAAKRVAAW